MSATNGGLTIKQGKFVRAYLKTGNASEAYRQAYDCNGSADTTINRNAHALLQNDKITARVEQLEQEAAEVARLDKSMVLAGLLQTARNAEKWEQAGPAARCWELLGKALQGGLFTDRSLVGSDQLSREQLIEQLADGDPMRRKLAERLLSAPRNFTEGANDATKKRFRSSGAG
jgi:hypothetical protein